MKDLLKCWESSKFCPKRMINSYFTSSRFEIISGVKEKKRLDTIYRFIGDHYQSRIEIQEVAELSNLTKEAFCRYFKKMTKLTFTQFVNHYRVDIAKKLLLQGKLNIRCMLSMWF